VLKSVTARLAVLEQRVERNVRHGRARNICNVLDNPTGDDLPAFLQRLWKEGKLFLYEFRTYHLSLQLSHAE
jgi:hypothetical protein